MNSTAVNPADSPLARQTAIVDEDAVKPAESSESAQTPRLHRLQAGQDVQSRGDLDRGPVDRP